MYYLLVLAIGIVTKWGDMDMNKRRDTIPEHFNSVEEADQFLGLPLWVQITGVKGKRRRWHLRRCWMSMKVHYQGLRDKDGDKMEIKTKEVLKRIDDSEREIVHIKCHL